MNIPYELELGWRYTRAGRARNRFISFISAASMVGIALGVAALIVVLSVMNGFQKEVRQRMLSVLAHVEITAADGQALSDWPVTVERAKRIPQVVGAAPYVGAQALLAHGEDMRGVMVRGIAPELETQVTDMFAAMPLAQRQQLQSGQFGVILGVELARVMQVQPGDQITLVAPGGQITPAGVLPRLKQMTVLSLFDSGHFEYDSSLVLMHMDDAARVFQFSGPSGVRLKLQDPHEARQVSQALGGVLPGGLLISDWTRQNRNWFAAVQLEKRMMFIILTLIVAVAAFNLVSMLVMTVQDKRSDIAILRTLGATPRSIMGIFMVQGAALGVMGTMIGLILGLALAFHVGDIVALIEHAVGGQFLPQDVYLISRMPSDPQAQDILPIVITALVLAFLATLYPSWRASRVNPAEALRYE